MDPLGTLIAWVAEYGVVGLILIAASERFVPVLPSYGVLVAIGIAAAGGPWSVAGAVAATAIGGVAGSLVLYGVALTVSEHRSRWLLAGAGRMVGMSAIRMQGVTQAFCVNQRTLAFGLQLVPTVRLVSPMIAGLFRADARTFTMATLSGIAIWNGLFIGIGYIAATVAPGTNASTLALQVLAALIVAEVTLALLWRRLRRAVPDGIVQ
ncbi:DedA family protein [Lysobacter sp. CA199]|uniref:DedA family protein n=1 Tax=Lysobacter sp. CA199 TaxID=3455608 RepID=UPI003F8D4D7D